MALDIEDLEVNGDTAAGAGPDQAFLQINNGILKLLRHGRGRPPDRRRDDQLGRDHQGPLLRRRARDAEQVPGRRQPRLADVARTGRPSTSSTSPIATTGAGDAALLSSDTDQLTIRRNPVIEVPSFPDSRMMLVNPRNFVRVICWQVRRRKVTGDTDWELATRDKRGYIFFLKHDIVIEEPDAVVDVYGLV